MSEADDLLRAGDIDGARRVLVDLARRDPADIPTRLFLFQLLAVAGEWTKAKMQLTTLAQLSPEAQMLSVVYGQAIDAEQVRTAVFAGSELASIHTTSSWAAGVADAIRLGAQGEASEADARREAAFAQAPDTPGEIDGTPVDWIGDADPRFGPTVEAIIGGRYGLLPFDAIAQMSSEGPKDLRDLVWYPVEITLKTGPRVAALLPVRYPGIPDGIAERLSRATDWGADGRGHGQRLWSGSDGEDRGLLTVRSLHLN